MVSEISRTLRIGWALACLGGQPLSSGFQTFLQNYISISIISKKFRTIPSVVSKKQSGQNFDSFGHARWPA